MKAPIEKPPGFSNPDHGGYLDQAGAAPAALLHRQEEVTECATLGYNGSSAPPMMKTCNTKRALFRTLDSVIKLHRTRKESRKHARDMLPEGCFGDAVAAHAADIKGYSRQSADAIDCNGSTDDENLDNVEPTPGVLGSILYDLSRYLQNQTSSYDAFRLLYGAVKLVHEKESAITYIRRRQMRVTVPQSVYHKITARRMNKIVTDAQLASGQNDKIFKRFTRAINVWGHHCCMDEIDNNKPYNEPPQIKCIKFDRTGEVIITGGDEGIIKLWNTFNCTLITSLRRHAGGIMCLDVHPNNHFLLSCCDGGELWLWEINGNLHRPHKRIAIAYKFVWCKFLCNPSERTPTSLRDRCEEEVRNSFVICVSANSQMRIYRMYDLITVSNGGNITSNVEPLYMMELFNHNIRAYDISQPFLPGDTSLIALGIEPVFIDELRTSEDASSLAMSIIQKEKMIAANKHVNGKYGRLSTSSMCALFSISKEGLTRSSIDEMDLDEHVGSDTGTKEDDVTKGDVSTCVCDVNRKLISDSAGNCACCFKKVASISLPPMKSRRKWDPKQSNYDEDTDLFALSGLSEYEKKADFIFKWRGSGIQLEEYAHKVLETYDLTNNTRLIDPSELEPANIQLSRLTSTVLFPSYMEDPWVSNENTEAESRNAGHFDDLLYHVQLGHEYSPDVCFANLSLNHITASDEGKLFLWTKCNSNMKFKSKTLYTRCLNRWLNRDDGYDEPGENAPVIIDESYSVVARSSQVDGTPFVDQSDNSLGKSDKEDNLDPATKEDSLDEESMDIDHNKDTSIIHSSGCKNRIYSDVRKLKEDPFNHLVIKNPYYSALHCDKPLNLLKEPDAFIFEGTPNPSMVERGNFLQGGNAPLFLNDEEPSKQSAQESGHHYVITDIAWSKTDRYIFIADSVVTRYNFKKLITASRTILSGFTVFKYSGTRIADFLHGEISHHVCCVRPHPVNEDIALAVTYGGVIYIISISGKSILKKFDCGSNAVWLDACWHPDGRCFVASQLYGCFSLFTTEDLEKNYKGTLNHQCGYSDPLPINTTQYYAGIEDSTAELRRYYHASVLLAPVELVGKRFDESLRMHTVNVVNTIMDENKTEVLVVSNSVPMQVRDTEAWSNHLLDQLQSGITGTIKAISKIASPIGVIEFLQWHCRTYPDVDIDKLLTWYLVINQVNVVPKELKDELDECPYGGRGCRPCYYLSQFEEVAKNYKRICKAYRGMHSRITDRGDIISCLPLAARPSGYVSHIGIPSVERRQGSPPSIRSSLSNGLTRSNMRSQGLRNGSSIRIQSRPLPTRVQPQRNQQQSQRATRARTSRSTEDGPSGIETPIRTPTRSMSITVTIEGQTDTPVTEEDTVLCSESLSQTENDYAMPSQVESLSVSQSETLQEQQVEDDMVTDAGVHDMTTNASVPDRATNTSVSDGAVSTTRRDASTNGSSQDSVNSKSSRAGNPKISEDELEAEIAKARRIGRKLGPVALNAKLRREQNITDIPCAICGFITETSRNQKSTNKKVWIGGSKLMKNAMLGPFIPSMSYMEALERKLPMVHERLQNSYFIHIGCIAAATYIEFDIKSKSIQNFPEFMTRGYYSACSYCKGNFATVYCSTSECSRVFHYPCAILCLEDESYGRRQPTARLNPSFLKRLDNNTDPLLCKKFFCMDCTLKSWVDGSFSLEPFCTGSAFLNEEPRKWFYGDSSDDSLPCYVPQGGDLVLIDMPSEMKIKANIAAMCTFQQKNPLMEIKKIDYCFYGPMEQKFGVATVLGLRPIDAMKLNHVFYYPGSMEMYPAFNLLLGLWRLTKIKKGDSVKVKHPEGFKEAIVNSVDTPHVPGEDLGIVPGDYGVNNLSRVAQAALKMGRDCVHIEGLDGSKNACYSAWDVRIDETEESSLVDSIKQKWFPSSAKEQLLNLTLDPAFENFNSIQSFEETTELWVKTYWRIIPNPMYLEKIRQRILNSYYRSPQAAFSDLEMVVQNCRYFNHPSSSICKELIGLEQAIATVRDDIRRIASADKYAKALMEFIWPVIYTFFDKGNVSKSSRKRDANGRRESSPVREAENTQRDHDRKRRSPHDRSPTQMRKRKRNSSDMNERAGSTNGRDSVSLKIDGSQSTPRSPVLSGTSSIRSRLAQSRVISDGEEGTSAFDATVMEELSLDNRNNRNTQHIKEGGNILKDDSYTTEGSSSSLSQRKSSRVAELSRREAERRNKQEQEHRELMRKERDLRYGHLEYNLRKK